jgi:phosphinothricin acetyltransferase
MPIRPAIEADLPAILAIYNHSIATSTAIWIDTPVDLADRRAWFLLRQSQGYPVLVVEEDGAVLGYASFGDFRPYEGFRATVEHSVYLAGDARGRGLGTALVEALFPLARACGKRIMVGAVDATNAASLRLHRKLGFRDVGCLPGVGEKFGRSLDMVLLQKELV